MTTGVVHVDLSGCTALVTGAASGIGRACALRLAAAGASVVVSGSDFYESCSTNDFRPLQNIAIEFVQSSATRLATVNARGSGQFDVEVHVPAGARSGSARFEARVGNVAVAARSFRVAAPPATATPVPSAAPEATAAASPAATETPAVAAPAESPGAEASPGPTPELPTKTL